MEPEPPDPGEAALDEPRYLREARQAQRRTLNRCVYCGASCYGKITCWAHADLPALDPFYIAFRVS